MSGAGGYERETARILLRLAARCIWLRECRMDRRPKCDHLSCTLRLSAITAAEAEDFLATTWRIVVENELPSPQIEARSVDTLIDIRLRFSGLEDCVFVERRFHEIVQSTRA